MAKKVEWNLLVKESLDGNKKSEAILFTKLKKYLTAMSYKLFKKSDDEFIQLTLSKCFRYLNTYDSERAQFTTWSTTILKNTFSRWNRRRLDRLNREVGVDQFFDDSGSASYVDDWQEVQIYEKQVTTYRMVLETDERFLILKMNLVDGYTMLEIASRLSMNHNTVKTRIAKQKVLLKEVLHKMLEIS